MFGRSSWMENQSSLNSVINLSLRRKGKAMNPFLLIILFQSEETEPKGHGQHCFMEESICVQTAVSGGDIR